MPFDRWSPVPILWATVAAFAPLAAAAAPRAADTVYRYGSVYTVDAADSVRQAIAIRGGRIAFVGDDAGVIPFIDAKTDVIDLKGRMLMPGLVDGHMHPLQGGAALLKCSLNYEQLTIVAMRAKIQVCLDAKPTGDPDAWLEVVNWFQEGMLPAGVVVDHGVLDALTTRRPILVESSFGHTSLTNTRGIDLSGVKADTPDPLGGKIGRDSAGNVSGLLDDAAQGLVSHNLPQPTPEDDVKSARAALAALRRQGVTTFLDAAAELPALAAFQRLRQEGTLTARAHFALLIEPQEGRDPRQATERVRKLAGIYDGGAIGTAPSLTVRNVKLFLDGVITAPAMTGAMLEPYLTSPGTVAVSAQAAGGSRGPDVYFPAAVLRALLLDVVAAGFEPHMHADGDRAVREGLDGIAAVREAYP